MGEVMLGLGSAGPILGGFIFTVISFWMIGSGVKALLTHAVKRAQLGKKNYRDWVKYEGDNVV